MFRANQIERDDIPTMGGYTTIQERNQKAIIAQNKKQQKASRKPVPIPIDFTFAEKNVTHVEESSEPQSISSQNNYARSSGAFKESEEAEAYRQRHFDRLEEQKERQGWKSRNND